MSNVIKHITRQMSNITKPQNTKYHAYIQYMGTCTAWIDFLICYKEKIINV